jgi:pyruvate formate lyase activating enzyme
MSTEDGPGLRTTVFLKGCSLQCAWCHNPEAMSFRPQLVWHPQKCIGTRECTRACEEQALARQGSSVCVDRELCTLCGDCVDQCPSAALEIQGAVWELEDLVEELAKDRNYFETSGGGITVSGGEPVLRAAFVAALFERCRALGLATALDTCGLCAARALLQVGRLADLVLYDLKEIDSEQHFCFTGQPNERILANLLELGKQMRREGQPADLWVRTPLIPGATFRDENILGLGAFLAQHLAGLVTRWELCAFNNLAGDKYERLGLAWPFEGTALLGADELRHAEEVARRSGVDPTIVLATGQTRLEKCGPPPTAGG